MATEAAAEPRPDQSHAPEPKPIPPRCRHHSECGGCGWQQFGYADQLRLKRERLQELLGRALGRRAPRVLPMIGLPPGADGAPWGFRQKAAFVFGTDPRDGGLAIGHYARGTRDVVPVSECPVHNPRGNRIAFALRDELRRAGLAAADQRNGILRHLVVRTSADESEAAAVLVVTRNDTRLRAPLQRLLRSPERPDGLMLNLHERPGPYLFGRETLRVDGPGHVRETGLGPSFVVSPTGFFQTNVAAAAELLRLVLESLPAQPPLSVLDLYAGSGLFALPLAQRGHRVVAVEESRKASREAGLNARLNGVPRERLRLVPSRVEDTLHRLRERFDAVVLDPPRTGCPPQVLRTLVTRVRPQRLLLVSCNPEALARELTLALDAGYRAQRVQGVDMFPHTPHIETLAVLVRADAPRRGRPSRTPSRGVPAGGSRSPRR